VHTKSELLFENYCREREYQVERITPAVNAGMFPDYRVITPEGPVIVEIKEFVENEEDKRFVKALNKQGHAITKRSPGKRVYGAIKDAAPQLRRYKDEAFPEVLLLYDNIVDDGSWPFGRNEYLAPLDISAGMFGSLVVQVWLHPNEKPTAVNDSTHGGKRQLTETERLYIGAVAVLNEATDQDPIRIDFFHNWFSSKRLRPEYFLHPSDRHFIKAGHPDRTGWEWLKFTGSRQHA